MNTIEALKNIAPWLFAFALIAFCVSIASSLTSTADTRVFLGESGEAIEDLRDFEAEFGRRSTLHFAVRQEKFAKRQKIPARALIQLEKELWALENVTSVVSAVSANHMFNTADGIEVLPYHQLPSEEIRSNAYALPLAESVLVSTDREWWAVVVEIDLPIGIAGKIVELNQKIRQIVDEVVSSHESARIVYTGELPLMAEFAYSAEKDSKLLVPFALFLILFIFFLSIQSWRVGLVLITLLAMAISLSLALSAAFGQPTNTATATIPLIVLIVVAANALHYFWSILHHSRANSEDSRALAFMVRKRCAVPLSISGFSTAGGFFLLLLASSPPFVELGWVVGVVVSFSTCLLLLWVPRALAGFPAKKLGESSEFISRVAGSLFLFGRSARQFWLFSFLMLFSLTGLLFLSINDDFTSYFPEESSFGKASKLVESKFGGPDYLEIVLSAETTNAGEVDSSLLSESAALAAWLRNKQEIRGVVSLSDSISHISEILGGDEAKNIEELLLVYEMGLPDGASVADRISDDRTKIRITAMLGKIDSSGILQLKKEIQRTFPYKTLVTGISVPTSEMAYKNTKDVLIGVAFAGVFIALIVYLLHRRLTISLIVFSFVLLPIGVGFGIWGWLVSDVGLATAAILAASVGIVVDDVVHIVYRYIAARDDPARSSETVLVQVMKEVAPPILISSIAIASGFGVLVFSDFGVNSTLGASVSTIVLCALLTVLLLLPRVLESQRN